MLKIARFVGCWFLFFFFVFTFIPVKMPCSATVFVVTIMALHTYLACSKEKVIYRLRSEKWLAISQFFFYLLQKKKNPLFYCGILSACFLKVLLSSQHTSESRTRCFLFSLLQPQNYLWI